MKEDVRKKLVLKRKIRRALKNFRKIRVKELIALFYLRKSRSPPTLLARMGHFYYTFFDKQAFKLYILLRCH